jgi:hypothetical protein
MWNEALDGYAWAESPGVRVQFPEPLEAKRGVYPMAVVIR